MIMSLRNYFKRFEVNKMATKPKKETAIIVKELIEINKKVERLRVWNDKVDFLNTVLSNFIKLMIVGGLLYSFFVKDILLMLLFIGTAIVNLGDWNERTRTE